MSQRPLLHISKTDPISPFAHPASKTALLLLDFMNLTVSMIPGEASKALLPMVVKLRDWALGNDVLIVHGLISADQGPSPHSKFGERWPVIKGMIEKSPDAMSEVDVLKPDASSIQSSREIVVSRRVGTLSALPSDGLLQKLKAIGITSVVIAGISTSACVLSTARASADEGFVVTVVEDACADPKEEIHRTVCRDILPVSANVVDLTTWEREWKA